LASVSDAEMTDKAAVFDDFGIRTGSNYPTSLLYTITTHASSLCRHKNPRESSVQVAVSKMSSKCGP